MYFLCTFVVVCMCSYFPHSLFEYLLVVLGGYPPAPVRGAGQRRAVQGSLTSHRCWPRCLVWSFLLVVTCVWTGSAPLQLSVIWFSVKHFYFKDYNVMWRMWNGMYIKGTGNFVCNSWSSYLSLILQSLLIILNTSFYDHCPWCVAGNTSIMWCKLIVTERTFRLVKVCFQSPNVFSTEKKKSTMPFFS